jgi:hypothetical protein
MTTATLFHRPALGDYYVCKVAVDGFIAGSIAVVSELRDDGREGDGTRIVVQYGNKDGNSCYYDLSEFEEKFQYMPDGSFIVQERVETEIRDAASAAASSERITLAMGKVAPHLEAPAEVNEKALVPAVKSLTETKAKVASIRNDAALLQLDMRKRQASIKSLLRLQQERMQALLRQQADALAGKLGDLETMLKKAEEAIWTINLYLGKDEQIVQIKKGKPAPKDSKIHVRQLVLFADEECAIGAEEGGIDATDLDQFDKWLCVPKNRMQVLPEAKGIVAIKPRRKEKNYGRAESVGEMWHQAEMALANKKTYFLMSNGENLYRICTELEVGDHLIPKENEHAELFFTKKFGSDEKEPIFPGDRRYMEAMEAAEGLKKHYLRILLFIQGLLDRTAVFAPLPAPRLNLLNRTVYVDHLVFISDAEKLLTTGRAPFKEWLASLNAKLDVGHRIIGAFGGRRHGGLSEYDNYRSPGNSRISPVNAPYPKDCVLYTIEGTPERGWFIRYERSDDVYRRGYDRSGKWRESGPAKRRASCVIKPSDRFILNVDDATIEDMEWYLNDRTNRHEYESMFPLLRTAIELKKKELAEEKPFRDLLANELLKGIGYDGSIKEMHTYVSGLVDWWKLKNKTHRALMCGEDAKALRMIVAEFVDRRKRARDRAAVMAEAMTLEEHIRKLHPEVVYIGHKKGSEFVALLAENSENVFVREQTWRHTGTIALLSDDRWKTVERKRVMAWSSQYESPRWKDWKIDAREAEHLTDPEMHGLVLDATDEAKEHISREQSNHWSDEKWKGDADLLSVTFQRGELVFYFWSRKAAYPKWVLTGKWKEHKVETVTFTWSKKKGKVTPHMSWGTHDVDIPENACDGKWRHGRIMQLNETMEQNLIEQQRRYEGQEHIKRELDSFVECVRDSAHEAMKKLLWQRKKDEFIAEYQHEELWEDHKKAIRDHEVQPPRAERATAAAKHLIERLWLELGDLEQVLDALRPLSIGIILTYARARGWKPDDKDEDKDMVPTGVTPDYSDVDERWTQERNKKLEAVEEDDEDEGDEIDAEDDDDDLSDA